ncbi:hypothetical protein Ahu01nite_077140 [Winogradskya humida]|uniref:Uncharacterized protein n=1 Tax=Winogradskya humida TaxID=113566 RepID=A0ABQ4A1B0_9ACTN|nr:hypothetical protein Ahu01nite_077140 [Actinoplanes humidus]
MQRRNRRLVTVRPRPVEQFVHMSFAGLKISRSKFLEVSGIHAPTLRGTTRTPGPGVTARRAPG